MSITTGSIVLDEVLKKLITVAITSTIKTSMAEFNKSLMQISGSINGVLESQEFLMGELRKLNGETQGNDHTRGISNCNAKYSSSSSYFGDDLRVSMTNDNTDEVKSVKEKDADKVFDEMPSIKSFKQEGTVQEFYETFSSLYEKLELNELYVINLFILGLQPEIMKVVSMFKPKTLWDVYCLARLEEATNNDTKKSVNPPFLPYPNLQDSSEISENINCLMTVDKANEVGKNTCLELASSSKPCKECDERSKIGLLAQYPNVSVKMVEMESYEKNPNENGSKVHQILKPPMGANYFGEDVGSLKERRRWVLQHCLIGLDTISYEQVLRDSESLLWFNKANQVLNQMSLHYSLFWDVYFRLIVQLFS